MSVPTADIPAAITAPRARIEAHLAVVVERFELPPALTDAISYALLGGGKRLRPLLAWYCGVAASGDPDAGPATLPAGAAVELVHAFSLVHDDLPAMDDDDTRRGRPTLHIHAGEAMAILAGDAMLALATDALDHIPEGAGPLDAPARLRLQRELISASLGMIAGQVLDTVPEARPAPDADGVARIHDLKTGALITAACRMGAIAALAAHPGGRSDAEARIGWITTYARAIGRMFQIVDDLLDVEQTAEHIGKATGKDEAAGKLTYPAVHGVEGSRTIVSELLQEALDAADKLGPTGETLKQLATFFARRTR